MRNVLIVDTETTGLDRRTDLLLEVGAVLWSVRHRTVLHAESRLYHAPVNPAEPINGIPAGAVQELASVQVAVPWVSDADAIVAHHADFDRQWLPELGKPWICTANDVAWPRTGDSRSLVAICLAHGVGVSHAHRALTDCLLIARLLERVGELGHDPERLLSDALLPRVTLQALHRFEDNDKAKAAGFRFDGATKRWLKRVRQDSPCEYPFKTRQVDQ